MIREVTSAPVDLSKSTQRSDRVELRDKVPQAGHVESHKESGDWVTLGSGESEALTYAKPLAAVHEIAIKYLLLQQQVTTLTVDQGAVGAISGGESINALMVRIFEKLGLSASIDIGGGKTADLQSMTVEDAQNLISDNGYWGVEQTSSRIVDFAVSQIGNAPLKLDEVKEAIMKGYNSAKEAFGGWLPDISQRTIDAVMNKLDNLPAFANS